MENLNKEFWDKLKEKYPNAMRVFLKWIEDKEDFKIWAALANKMALASESSRLVSFAIAPLIEHLPLGIQFGIFTQYSIENNYAITKYIWSPEGIGELVENYMIIAEPILLGQSAFTPDSTSDRFRMRLSDGTVIGIDGDITIWDTETAKSFNGEASRLLFLSEFYVSHGNLMRAHEECLGKETFGIPIHSEVLPYNKLAHTKMLYITLDVNKIENIIINSINKVYGSHIGYITKQLKEDLIKHAENKK